MHLFSCPFCGPRAEPEFRYGAEAGKTRGDRASSDAAWSDYLYVQENPKGETREIWIHLPCGEFFLMERNSVTHAVSGSRGLRREDRA